MLRPCKMMRTMHVADLGPWERCLDPDLISRPEQSTFSMLTSWGTRVEGYLMAVISPNLG